MAYESVHLLSRGHVIKVCNIPLMQPKFIQMVKSNKIHVMMAVGGCNFPVNDYFEEL